MTDSGDWKEWSRHVLAELQRLNEKLEQTRQEVHDIRVQVALLQVKAGVWGAVAGAVIVLVPYLAGSIMGAGK
jgi:hypothetical protein